MTIVPTQIQVNKCKFPTIKSNQAGKEHDYCSHPNPSRQVQVSSDQKQAAWKEK